MQIFNMKEDDDGQEYSRNLSAKNDTISAPICSKYESRRD